MIYLFIYLGIYLFEALQEKRTINLNLFIYLSKLENLFLRRFKRKLGNLNSNFCVVLFFMVNV